MNHEMDEIKELGFLVISLSLLYSVMALISGNKVNGLIQILETLTNALIASLIVATTYSIIKNKFLTRDISEKGYIPFSPAKIKAMKNSKDKS